MVLTLEIPPKVSHALVQVNFTLFNFVICWGFVWGLLLLLLFLEPFSHYKLLSKKTMVLKSLVDNDTDDRKRMAL